ncbi:hypothetical protein GCM10023238_24580 [Streptomyces heliomycini]
MRPTSSDALAVGGDLGAQVGEVGLRVAGGVGGLGEETEGLLLAETAVLGEQPVVEEDALLVDVRLSAGMDPGRCRRSSAVVAA